MQSPEEILLGAFEDAKVIEKSDDRTLYRLDIQRVVRNFKADWLYANQSSLPLPTNATSGSHLFLLQKNLNVTNISMAEIVVLLRLHTIHRDSRQTKDIHFFSEEEYSTHLSNVIASLYADIPICTEDEFSKITSGLIASLLSNHASIIYDTVIFDSFFTSVLIHIPLSLSVNVDLIVAESGYISSAGHAIYIRKADKAEIYDLERSLSTYLEYSNVEKPVYITPYTNEYLEPYEQKFSTVSIRNGLDGVRLELRKHQLSAVPLRDALNSIATRVDGLVLARGLENYSTERKNSTAGKTCTIWLIADHRYITTSEQTYVRSRQAHLIVYAQYQLNSNQLILFKERKPAWTAPITLPHTLSGAMINLARLNLVDEQANARPIILDPFCGTGTTLFDASIRIPHAVVVGLDRDPLMPAMVRDNLEFFSMDRHAVADLLAQVGRVASELRTHVDGNARPGFRPIKDLICEVATPIEAPMAAAHHEPQADLELALKMFLRELTLVVGGAGALLDRGVEHLLNNHFSAELVALFHGGRVPYRSRLFFYLVWRAIASRRHALRGDTGSLYAVILKELDTFLKELDEYHGDICVDPAGSINNEFQNVWGTYSRASLVDISRMRERADNLRVVGEDELLGAIENSGPGIRISTVQKSEETLAKLEGKIDLLIGDPPYGFNTNSSDTLDMQEFYSRFIDSAVGSLKRGGQLMITVPAFARNGRHIPYFQTRGVLTRQIIAGAEKRGRRVINIVRTNPADKALFNPPFYWQSVSALSRSILWFTIE